MSERFKLLPDDIFGVKGLGRLHREHWKPFLFGRKPFEVRTASGAVFVRPRSFADMYQIQEVMDNYSYKPSESIGRVETAIDLGASIGDSTLWLIKEYNPKTLVAVEMNGENFRLLERNLEHNGYGGEVITINKAVYKEDGMVGVHINKSHAGHHMVDEASRHTQEAITLASLLNQVGVGRVDYLKMDIEGAEKFVCVPENDKLFRERIRYVHMEVHDESQGGQDMQKTVKYFENLGFRVKTKPAAFRGAMMLEAFNPAILGKMES